MKNTMPVEDYLKLHGKSKTGNKYHNKPTTREVGERIITFHSKKEAEHYDTLMLMLKAGEISDLRLQPQYTLQEAYTTPEGERIRAIRYTADFSYRIQRMWEHIIVVDVKGGKATKTADYKLKKKLMQERFGISVREI